MNPPQKLPQHLPTLKDMVNTILSSPSKTPNAWTFTNNHQWQMIHCVNKTKRIEGLARQIIAQRHLALLTFSATIGNASYSVIYLFDGQQFSHTVFQPQNKPDQWWIEPWSIDHLLS